MEAEPEVPITSLLQNIETSF